MKRRQLRDGSLEMAVRRDQGKEVSMIPGSIPYLPTHLR